MAKGELRKAEEKRMVDMLRKYCSSRNEALALVHRAFPNQWGMAIEDAESFLLEQLQDGPKRLSTLLAQAKPLGLRYQTLRRASIKLRVINKTKGFGKYRVARWRLP